jgi:hypothetical protein
MSDARATAEPASPGRWWRPLRGVTPQAARGGPYLAVGITNSAPLPIDSGQRCMMDFCFV